MASHISVRGSVIALVFAAGCMSSGSTESSNDLGTSNVAANPGTSAATSALVSVTDLSGDQAGAAANQLPSLVNAWGIVAFQNQFWIADNASGKVSIVDSAGKPSTKPASDAIDLGEGITGVTTNPSNAMQISGVGTSCGPASLIFGSEHGKLIGVNPDINLTGTTLVDRSSVMADYTGVATIDLSANKGMGVLTLAADFHNARIDVFDENFHLMTTPAWTLPAMPANFAPFNIMEWNNVVYVTYAEQNATKDDSVAGAGLGFVAAFDTAGKLMWTTKGAQLDAPWGMTASTDAAALAPGMLLVGNFGDGHVTEIKTTDGTIADQLMGSDGKPLAIDGLWGITTGTGVTGTMANGVYFAAGPADESHGMFGVIAPATTTTTTTTTTPMTPPST
jgi:uncharacterized protein (TIGR03118 family)